MKINFDWNSFTADNSKKKGDKTEITAHQGTLYKAGGLDKSFLNISGKLSEDFSYGDQGIYKDEFLQSMDSDKLVSMNRNKMAMTPTVTH